MERDSPPSSNRLCHVISVEQIGSGIRRIRDVCLEYGVAEPIFEVSHDWLTLTFPRQEAIPTAQVTTQVRQLIVVIEGEMTRAELMTAMNLKNRSHFSRAYLQPGLEAGLIEMTIPDRPRSRTQRYRLTASGSRVREALAPRILERPSTP